MKHAITLLTALLLVLTSWGQTISTPHVVSFTGEYIYVVTPVAYGFQVEFTENSNICDPVKGVVSLEEQILVFTEAAKKIGITANEMHPVLTGSKMGPFTRSKCFKIVVPTKALSNSLKLLCNEHGVKIEQQFRLLNQNDPADNVEKAVAALADANHQANSLANHLGKKVARVISIDDCRQQLFGKGSAASTGVYYAYDSYDDDDDEDFFLFNENGNILWYSELFMDKFVVSSWDNADYYSGRPLQGVYRLRVSYLLE